MKSKFKLIILFGGLFLILLLPLLLVGTLGILILPFSLSRARKTLIHLFPFWSILVLPVALGHPEEALYLAVRSFTSFLFVSCTLKFFTYEDLFEILKILPDKISLTALLILQNFQSFLESLSKARSAMRLKLDKPSPSIFGSVLITLIKKAEIKGNNISYSIKLRDLKWK